MRTTVTLDADVAAQIRRVMVERGIGFKEAINDTLRRGIGGGPGRAAYRIAARDLGQPLVPLEKALDLAAALEDEELIRKVSVRK